jgi:hypothetical protein
MECDMTKAVWMHHGPFPSESVFVPNKVEWKKLMRKLKAEDEPYPVKDACVTTFFDSPIGRVRVLTVGDHLTKKCTPLRLAALIGHEVQHIWQGIKVDAGETEPGSECEAYMVQWLLTQALEAFEATRFKLFKGAAA